MSNNDITQRSFREETYDLIITKINNKYYDLSEFQNIHPIGSIPIELTHKRDATGLFFSHHQFSSGIKERLSKYEITEEFAKTKGVFIETDNTYNWEESLNSEFYRELKKGANEILGKNIKADIYRFFEITVLFLIFLSQYYFFIKGYYFSIFTISFTYWVFGANIFHDASHFTLSFNEKINRLGLIFGFNFYHPYIWYHSHVIGHHVYPNIRGKDPDIYTNNDYFRHSEDIEAKKIYKNQRFNVYTYLISIPLGSMCSEILNTLKNHRHYNVLELIETKNLNKKDLIYRMYFAHFVMVVVPLIIHGISIKGILFAVVPWIFFSTIFMAISQINHLTTQTDELKHQSKNFFIHQIQTSNNFATNSYLTFLFTGGLNLQIEHHLFPSVNHAHLWKLIPLVKRLCLKYKITYNEYPNIWQAIYSHWKHLIKYQC